VKLGVISIQESIMEIVLNSGKWLNEPKLYHIGKDSVFITTEPETESIRFGVYACSPTDSSFRAEFSGFKFEHCNWNAHSTE